MSIYRGADVVVEHQRTMAAKLGQTTYVILIALTDSCVLDSDLSFLFGRKVNISSGLVGLIYENKKV